MSKPNMRKIHPSLLILFSLLLLTALYGCGTGADVTTTSGNTTVGTSTLTLSITSSAVTFGTPVTATAVLKDANGVVVPNTVVTFAASSNLVVFTPTSATALTNTNGIASVTVNAASTNSTGATSITASVSVTSGTTTSTLTSAPVGINVNGAAVSIQSLTLSTPSISAYASSLVSAVVWINGAPATVPISVAFTSPCAASSKATLTSPVTTVAGTATSTYTDNNCASGTDVITASVTGGNTATATITVAVPATNSIKYVSATPAIIGTKGTGAATLSQSSVVKFKVVDSNNNGKAGVLVDFSLNPPGAPGGITFTPTFATSDSNGEVSTTVSAGTVPTSISVVANVRKILLTDPTISTQSNSLTITTGLPTQNFFSLSVQTHNIEGWNYDGVTSTVTLIASDRLGNPVPDGTAINFITEGAQIRPASCTTTNGTCTVTFVSSAYKPIDETTTVYPSGAIPAFMEDGITPITITYNGVNLGQVFVKKGRVTILAYAVGEKSFIDSNHNNIYDAGETFYDIGDLYIDSNENGTWDSNTTQPNLLEYFVNYAPVASPVACVTHIGSGGTTVLPDNYLTAPSKDYTCDGIWGINYVRRSQTMVLSASSPILSDNRFYMSSACTRTFTFWLMDANGNPMPAGTTVGTANNFVYFTASGTATLAAVTVGGTPIIDTTHAGGTRVSLSVDGGTECNGTGSVPYPRGSVSIVTTTPKGLSTLTPVNIY